MNPHATRIGRPAPVSLILRREVDDGGPLYVGLWERVPHHFSVVHGILDPAVCELGLRRQNQCSALRIPGAHFLCLSRDRGAVGQGLHIHGLELGRIGLNPGRPRGVGRGDPRYGVLTCRALRENGQRRKCGGKQHRNTAGTDEHAPPCATARPGSREDPQRLNNI